MDGIWFVFGGIFIVEMDPELGFPFGSGDMERNSLGEPSRIEGPYILYNPTTEYYYLFLSFSGLDSRGGYNIRVARPKILTVLITTQKAEI